MESFKVRDPRPLSSDVTSDICCRQLRITRWFTHHEKIAVNGKTGDIRTTAVFSYCNVETHRGNCM